MPERRASSYLDCRPWLAAGLLAVGIAVAAGEPASAAMQIAVEGDRLSADVSLQPIADVLRAVAEQTGARLSIKGELGNTSPQAFTRLPLMEALPRLALPNGLILEFAADARGGRKLVAIRAVAPTAPSEEAGGVPGVGIGVGARPIPQINRSKPSGLWDYEKADKPLPPVEQRVAAIQQLGRQRGDRAAAMLSYMLRDDPDPAVRRAAIAALAGQRSQDGQAAMTEAVSDVDAEVRADALTALASTGKDKPVALLAQSFQNDADLQVRLTALKLLSPRDGDVARQVLNAAVSDDNPYIRQAAEEALSRR